MPPLESQADLLRRIADALERLAPAARRRPTSTPPTPSSGAPIAARWRRSRASTASTYRSCAAIDRVRDLLLENTQRFARGLPANNALLWGARGMGKSSLVKAAHAAINRESGAPAVSSWSRSTARTSRACRR